MASSTDRRNIPFGGATAPWAEEEEDSYTSHYDSFLRQTAVSLRKRLDRRSRALASEGLTLDAVHSEVRRQMAECVADGDLFAASELCDAVFELLALRDDRHSL